MLDMRLNKMIMWQTYRDRLVEAEKNWLARQAQTGHRRHSHFLAGARVRLEGHPSALQTEWPGHIQNVVKEATASSKIGGGPNV